MTGYRVLLTGGPDDGKICFFTQDIKRVYTVVKPIPQFKILGSDEVYLEPIKMNIYTRWIDMENVIIFKFEGIKD